jgi:hypothetical protein
MVGLLAAAHAVACADDDSPTNSSGDGDGDSTSTGGTQPNDGSGGEVGNASGGRSGSGGIVNGDTGGTTSDLGGSAGEGGAGGAPPVEGVISTEIIADLTLQEFTEMCGEAGGVVETHASCGGVVSGPGFSYDDATHAFTEHTCAGYNTCSGFSCVIDD